MKRIIQNNISYFDLAYAVKLKIDFIGKITEDELDLIDSALSDSLMKLGIELFDDEQAQFHIGLMNWGTKDLKILTNDSYKYQQCPNFVIKRNTINNHKKRYGYQTYS